MVKSLSLRCPAQFHTISCPRHTDDLVRLRNKPIQISRFQVTLVIKRTIWYWRWRAHTYCSVLYDISHHPLCVYISLLWVFFKLYKRNSQITAMYFTPASPKVKRTNHLQHFARKNNTRKIKVRRRIYGKHLYGLNHSSFGENNSAGIRVSPVTKENSVCEGVGHLLQGILMPSAQVWTCKSESPTFPSFGRWASALWAHLGRRTSDCPPAFHHQPLYF